MIETLSGLLTPLIAVLTGYIAIQQYKISHQSLNLARFDRRIVIYQEVKSFLSKILSEGDISYEEIGEFQRRVSDADFLFSKDISKYLHQIVSHANKLRAWKDQYRDYSMTKPEGYNHSEVVQGKHEELLWLSNEWENSRQKFLPYLSIGNDGMPSFLNWKAFFGK